MRPQNHTKEEAMEIITRGTRRLIAQGGMGNFSFPKLSAETGIVPPTVYEHYKNKEELLACCFQEIDEEIARLVAGYLRRTGGPKEGTENLRDYSEALWWVYWDYLTEDADRTLFYWHYLHSPSYTVIRANQRRKTHHVFIDFCNGYAKKYRIIERFNIWVLISSVVDGTVGMAASVLRGDYPDDETTVKTIEQTILQPVFYMIGSGEEK